MANTILSFLSVLAFITVLFGLVASTSTEILSNPQLDNDSIANLATLIVQTNAIDITNSTITNVTINSTFEGTDAFQREFLESKSISENERSAVDKIIGVPNLILTAIGLEQESTVTSVLQVVVFILGIMIILIIFKGWKTGQVD